MGECRDPGVVHRCTWHAAGAPCSMASLPPVACIGQDGSCGRPTHHLCANEVTKSGEFDQAGAEIPGDGPPRLCWRCASEHPHHGPKLKRQCNQGGQAEGEPAGMCKIYTSTSGILLRVAYYSE